MIARLTNDQFQELVQEACGIAREHLEEEVDIFAGAQLLEEKDVSSAAVDYCAT